MASSQTKPDAEGRLRFLRNPLRLLKPKLPISSAQGHVFAGDLSCSHCGRTWSEQRIEGTVCGSETVATPTDKPVDDS